MHYVNLDKRMDEWLPGDAIHRAHEAPPSPPPRKRKRSSSSRLERRRASTSQSSPLDIAHTAGTSGTMNGHDANSGGREAAVEEMVITEEDFDIRHHNKITAQRNFDKVNFGMWQIKTWCVAFYLTTWAGSNMHEGISPRTPLPRWRQTTFLCSMWAPCPPPRLRRKSTASRARLRVHTGGRRTCWPGDCRGRTCRAKRRYCGCVTSASSIWQTGRRGSCTRCVIRCPSG